MAGIFRKIAPWPMGMAIALSAAFALPEIVASQTASEVTPDSFQPPQQRLSGAVVFTGQAGTQAPPGSENLSIQIADVTIEDPLPQLDTANSAYRERLTRGRIAVSEIFEATADLEAAYAQAGFVLTRVVLPEQSLSDGGVLRVVVVNGFVEAVDDSRVSDQVRGRVGGLTQNLLDKPGLTLAELERALLLAGDTPGVALGSALAAGQRPGGTIIALDPQFRPVTGFVGFDNLVSDDLGEPILNGGLELNSLFNLGESIYFRATGSPSGFLSGDPRYRTLAAGVAFPIGLSGLTFNLEFTNSRTQPDTIAAPTTSTFDRQSLRLFYPWIRSRNVNLSSQFSIDFQQDEQDLAMTTGDSALYRDELVALRFGTNLSLQQESGAFFQGGVILSQGLDGLGARSAADAASGPPLSRQGADADFSKLVLAASYQQPLGENLSLALSGRVQSSFGDALVTSEQFSITGAQELSSLDSGAVRGDNGWVLRGELSTQRRIDVAGLSLVASPYLFAAFGSVKRERPTTVETSRTDASAYGIGVDLFLSTDSRFRSSSVRVEFGRGERDDSVPDDNRLTIFGTYRF
ncbi:MAG: ShlB/FhaC/HecB family hemolysin secretion/activation protein [Pseudomonadota bacterium]